MQEQKQYNDYKKTRPVQLELFNLPVIFEDKRDKYSGTVELYDIIPKYINSDIEKLRKNGKYLDILTRNFIHRKQNMKLNITPARLIQKDGSTKDFFPSQREEIVEDVLRKFATNPKRNEFLDDRLSVRFTLYELYKELKKIKHSLSYYEIKESLNILSKTNLEIKSEDDKITFSSNMFETVGIVDKNKDNNLINNNIESKEYNKKIVYFVRFNSLVSNSIKDKTWRIINYEQYMTYRKVISRWLHKRISHMFLVDRITIPYNILLSTIIRDSGMTSYSLISGNARQVEECLKEMLKVGSIYKYEIKKIYSKERANKLEDVKFLLWVSESFYDDIQLNNLSLKDIKETKRIKNINSTNLNKKNIKSKKDKSHINSDLYNNSLKKELIQRIIVLLESEKLVFRPIDVERLINSIEIDNNKDDNVSNIYTVDNVILSTKACIKYIKDQIKSNKKCNTIAILTKAIKDSWQLSNDDVEKNYECNINNKQELVNKQIEEFISNQTNKNNKKYNNEIKLIFEKLREIFGDNIFQCWIMGLKYLNIKNKVITFVAENGFVRDYIYKEILDDKIKRKDGKDILVRKGMKQICQSVIPDLESVNIVAYKD